MDTTAPTTNAFIWTIPSSMGASNISDHPTATISSGLTATITASGSQAGSTSKWRIGTGPFARIGAGTAVTTSWSMKTPTTPAGTCFTTFTPAPTYTFPILGPDRRIDRK